MIKLSISSMSTYLDCPAKWYFQYIRKIPQKVDYPRLCGQVVHTFIASLYNNKATERKFLYKTIDSARHAWFYTWTKQLEKNNQRIVGLDSEKGKIYGGVGWECIQTYWNQNFDKPDPIAKEKRFSVPYRQGVELIGVVDQIRNISSEFIPRIRPELVNGSELDPKFDPVVIVDFKSGRYDYEVPPDSTEIEAIRHQIDLQRNLQASAYSLLYQKYHSGRLPLGFYLYQLRNGKLFFVRGDDEESQKILTDNINHVLGNIVNESFPKNPGPHCRTCDYVESCIENSDFYISNALDIPDSIFVAKKKVDRPRQLRFRLK